MVAHQNCSICNSWQTTCFIGDAIALEAISGYDYIKPENKGKQIYICTGSASLCAGIQKHVSR